jgi:hypothetical protein
VVSSGDGLLSNLKTIFNIPVTKSEGRRLPEKSANEPFFSRRRGDDDYEDYDRPTRRRRLDAPYGDEYYQNLPPSNYSSQRYQDRSRDYY